MPVVVSTLGFPRMGPRCELKSALESHWKGQTGADALQADARALRAATWARQAALGATHLPSNDFSFYDHMLDASVLIGAVPAAYGWTGGPVPLATYFSMACGIGGKAGNRDGETGLPALEKTRWFDTSHHCVIPELARGQSFTLASTKPVDEFLEAKALGLHTRPVLIGPVTWLRLATSRDGSRDPLSLLPGLLPVYAELLRRLIAAGADWVQIDEPCLVLDLDERTRSALRTAYGMLAREVPRAKLLLTTYFGGLGDNLDTALALPVDGLHLDLVRAPAQLAAVLERCPAHLALSLGVVDGRNVWRADLSAILDRLEPALARLGAERLMLGPSCSLMHVPIDLALEAGLDAEVKGWLAFAVQKVEELATLGRALTEGRNAVRDALDASVAARESRLRSARTHDPVVRDRIAGITAAMARRPTTVTDRRRVQRERLPLPIFPTTTVGTFPLTTELREARSRHAERLLPDAGYTAVLRRETEAAIRWQEEICLDLLVHGAFERDDPVQYFGERMSGFIVTRHGWVQRSGSDWVRPPIIVGDVSRPAPMTVAWSIYAQSLTDRPVKGLLTGPVSILHGSFVRDDLPRMEICRQIALAIRDEIGDLESAGIPVIQIDEPALHGGLPLRSADQADWLANAVDAFRLASSGVADATQIHTYLCGSAPDTLIDAVASMEADVVFTGTLFPVREQPGIFAGLRLSNEIGLGVYDACTQRCPTVDEMVERLKRACGPLYADRLWVNPNCGLKDRSWSEVRPALVNMVAAAKLVRQPFAGP